ncbi:MAG TPA: hypothetical protein VFA12_01460 [Stellaceae bacterium]|nr:hypothetical protein [Stellaceae bacterium]
MSFLRKVLAALVPLALAPAVALAQPVLPNGGGGGGGGGGSPSTPAPGGLITKLTGPQLQQLYVGVQIAGQTLQTSLKTFDDGSAVVYLPIWGPQVTSGADLESCAKDGSGCAAIEFFVNLGQQPSINAAWIEAFNEKIIGGKAYINPDDKGLVISYAFFMETGVTKDFILNATASFKNMVTYAMQFKP